MQISELRNPITKEQAARLESIFTDAFDTPPSDTFLERLHEKTDLSVLIAEEDGEIVGFKIGYMRFRGIFFSWLGAVAMENRRNGIGRALLKRQHELCSERGYDEIQAESAGSNQAMLILNLQEGFEVSGMHLGRNDVLTVQLRKQLASIESK